MEPIARIRELLFDGMDPWLARCFYRYLQQAHKGLTMEAAFRLSVARGKPPWWRVETLKARDAHIRALAQEIAPGLPVNAQAKVVQRMTNNYLHGRWRFDAYRDSIPLEYIGKRSELLYMAFRLSNELGGEFPGKRQLRKILSPESRLEGQSSDV